MRYHAPMIQCDAEDGFCGAQTDDYYEQTASSVDGTRITHTEPAPGWRSTSTEDYCPEHAALAEVGLTEKNTEKENPMEHDDQQCSNPETLCDDCLYYGAQENR